MGLAPRHTSSSQVARFQGREVYAFTRRGDREGQQFALSLGAAWAGDSETLPPAQARRRHHLRAGGRARPARAQGGRQGRHGGLRRHSHERHPSFPYDLLWEERSVCSVANLTRRDGEEFFALAPRVPVRTTVQTFPLIEANESLDRLRTGRIHGAAVLVP